MKRILASVAAAGLLLSIVSGVLPTAAAAQCSAGLSASEGGGCVGTPDPTQTTTDYEDGTQTTTDITSPGPEPTEADTSS
jgi:hypothetical protein